MMHRIVPILSCMALIVRIVPCGIAADDAERLSKSGVQTLVAGDAQQAVELLTRAISLNPTIHRYYNDRGVALKRLGKLDEAIADYTKALELQPDFTSALNNRGVGYLEKGLYDKALEDFTSAVKLGDSTSKLFTNRGLAHALMGDQTKALADFKKATSVRPVDSRAFIFAGDTLLKLGDKPKAFQMYQLAASLAKDPKVAEQIEARLSSLEQQVFTPESLQGPRPSAKSEPRAHKEHAGKASRFLSRGREGNAAQVAVPDQRGPKANPLYAACRENVIKRLPHEVAELYRRGEEYLVKSDAPKALLMYEDALELAKRHRAEHAEAWTLVEIGRVHAALGDHLIASRYMEMAIDRFGRYRAENEKAAALAELTWLRKPGRPEWAAVPQHAPERKPAIASDRAKRQPGPDVTAGKREPSPKPPLSELPKPPAPPAVPPPPAKTDERKIAGTSEQKPPPAVQPATTEPAPVSVDRSPGKRSHQAGRLRDDPIRQILKRTRAQAIETTPGMPPQSGERVVRTSPTAVEPEPVRVKRAAEPVPSSKSVEDLLSDLNRMRATRDERSMIRVLELLALEYEKKGKPDKALLCWSTSIAFRDKLGITDGIAKALLQAGTLKEKADHTEEALSDYTRALAAAQKEKKADQVNLLKQSCESVAKKLGLEIKSALDGYAALWNARNDGDEEGETRALQAVAALYERAGRSAAAAEYYAKTAALMAAQRASLLKKAGKPAEAEESIKQALGEFKTLDYSRYLLIMRKSKEPGPLSRHE